MLGILAALIVALSIIGVHGARVSRTAHVATVVAPHPALPPCRSYSSLVKDGIAVRAQCLD
jgi:hypothetical protein